MVEIFKKNNLFIQIISILVVIPFYYIVGIDNIFPYVIAFSLYLILVNIFNHLSVYNYLKKYHDLDYKYSQRKLLKINLIMIVILNMLLSIIITLFGCYLAKLLMIDNLQIIFLVMSLSLFADPFVKIIKDYLEINNYIKISNKLYNLYTILNVILFLIIAMIVFLGFNIKDNISIILLFVPKIISGLLVLGLYLFIIRKDKVKVPKREENKLDFKLVIRNICASNVEKSLSYVILFSYIYISIIFSFCSLSYQYGYNYMETSNLLSITYFYGISLMGIVIIISFFFLNSKLENIITNIKNNIYDNLSKTITMYLNDMLKIILPVIVLVSVLSGPIWLLIFNDTSGALILLILSYLAIFLLLYLIVTKLILTIKNKKTIYLYLFVGIVVKLIITLPLIDSFYRMGYNIINGDIVSTMISFTFSVIIGLFILNKKYKINFFKSFDETLKLIYQNIILCLILILLQLIISLKVYTRIDALISIIIYIVIVIIYQVLKNKLPKITKKIKIRH